MTKVDRLIAAGLSFFSFVLCFIRYWYPGEAYFDEIYYPRSALEYLTGQPQFEWTHPPLTKLLIALSMLLFGGAHSPLGNSGWGWRFLNVVVGALTVYLLYAFARRITGSTRFATVAAVLLVFDGFHFVQSRIATPEITVAFFCLAILYAFYAYWERVLELPTPADVPAQKLTYLGVAAIAAGAIAGPLVTGVIAHQTHGGPALIGALVAFGVYGIGRVVLARPNALRELVLLTLACGLGAASKWNTLFDVILVLAFAAGIALLAKPRFRLPLDAFVSIVMGGTIAIYLIFYAPFFAMTKPVDFNNGNDLTGFMDLQNQMFTYHDVTVAGYKPHPYSSKWWEWPLLIQPVSYYYHDSRTGAAASDPHACCVSEIISLSNPVTWWSGIISIPLLGWLAWKRRNRAYALLFCAYFAQWLPWIASPRMLFAYHFFPNDAIILIADAIALQALWEWGERGSENRMEGVKTFAGCYLVATVCAFIYFYPVLAGDKIAWSIWDNRMWLHHWIIGPG